MKIEKGMEVYISDKMMELNKVFLKKNGPYIVKDVYNTFGNEMARLIEKDSKHTGIDDYMEYISFPTNELYVKDNKKQTIKLYKTSNDIIVESKEDLHFRETVLMTNNYTGNYRIDSIASDRLTPSNEKLTPLYTVIKSLDAGIIDGLLQSKINIDSKEAIDIIKESLNINTVYDLNKYTFITIGEIRDNIIKSLEVVFGKNKLYDLLKNKETQESIDRLVEAAIEVKNYIKVPKITGLYYK